MRRGDSSRGRTGDGQTGYHARGPADQRGGHARTCRGGRAKEGRRIIIGTLGEAQSINPLLSNETEGQWRDNLMFDEFVKIDLESLKPTPNIARDWKVSDDGTEYTFTLREDVKFTDGHPLTANDVSFTFHGILKKEVASLHVPRFNGIKGVKPYSHGKAQADQLKAAGNLVVLVKPQGVDTNGWSFGQKSSPALKDARVRRAIAMALDTQRFSTDFLLGVGQPAKSPIPPGSWAYNQSLSAIPYDPAQAKQLLQQAGVSGLKVRLTTNAGNHFREDWVTFTQQGR